MQGDALNPEDLKRAVEGCRAAYYLVNFTGPALRGDGYEKAEARAALNMAAASAGSSLEKIISSDGSQTAPEASPADFGGPG